MLSFLNNWNPTKDQWISYLGTAVKVGGGFLVGRGVAISPDVTSIFFGPEALQFYAGVITAGLPIIRDRYIHSNSGKLAAASTLAAGPNPVIKKIETLPSAPPDIKAVADDKSVPGVVEAPSSYTPPPTMKR